MRLLQSVAQFIFFLLIAGMSACTPLTSSPAATALATIAPTTITGQPVPRSLASLTGTPVKTATITPGTTFRPQPTCTACTAMQTPATQTPTSTLIPKQDMVVRQAMLDVWDDPANENSYWHRQTQLITGEHVLALGKNKNGDWTQIIAVDQPSKKDAQGYPGWVRTDGLAPSSPEPEELVIVMVRSTTILNEPQTGATSLLRLYLDTRLPVVSKNESWVESLLPGGQNGWLRRSDVRVIQGKDEPATVSQLIETARTLAGAPYLWGGTTTDNPDCSGFIYRLFHAYGITLARDADDQAQMGEPIPFDQKKTGDLIFYADVAGGPVTHVGLYVGNNQLMDANPWLGLSLHPLADMQKWYSFHSVRRVLP